jgi:hypothetical protein
MQIHVGRSGQQLGILSPDQIRAALASGQLRPDDIAWHEGLADWTPLASLAVLQAAAPATLSPPTAPSDRPAAHPATGAPAARAAPIVPRERQTRSASPWRRRFVLWTVLALLAGVAVLSVPEARSKWALFESEKTLKSLVAVCQLYASEHDGAFPAQLEDLEKQGLLPAKLLRCPFGKDDSPVGYHYFGNGVKADAGKKALLITRATDGAGKRLVAYADGTVEPVLLPSVPPAK